MGARLFNNPRTTNRGNVNAFPALQISALRKFGAFKQGQWTAVRYGAAVLIIVDLRFEHDLRLAVKHGNSITDLQVIRLTHRPSGFNGRRWYFVSEKGERAETLFLVDGRFQTRREARLTYPSQSMGKLDRLVDKKQKLEARLNGTGGRGPARGRRRKQAEKGLEEIEHALNFIGSGIVRREQDRRAHARERRRRSSQRLEAASAAMTQRIDTPAEWVITTFRGVVDGLKAGTISSAPSPIAPKTNPDAQVDIGILQRMDLVQPGKMLGGQLGWPEAWIPEPNRRLFFIIDLRDRKRPCAVFVICDPERQAHQLFALKRMKGRFGRQEYRFICPNTARQSITISYLNGQFFCSS